MARRLAFSKAQSSADAVERFGTKSNRFGTLRYGSVLTVGFRSARGKPMKKRSVIATALAAMSFQVLWQRL
jgi:hypothetical protein